MIGFITKTLFRPIKMNAIGIALVVGLYVIVSLCLYYFWIAPTLDGVLDAHIAADSGKYMYFGQSLLEGRNDPFVLMSMYSFPNTLWAPVLMWMILPNGTLVLLANYVLFVWAVWLFSKVADVRMGMFLALLLGNYTTLISLLTLNKEILDLLGGALFCYWIANRKRWALLLALALSLLNRYEVCAAMVIFVVAQSSWNPIRRRRGGTVIALYIVLSIALPLVLSHDMSSRMEEAEAAVGAGGSGILIVLDTLQTKFLFFLVSVPKMALNLFGELRQIPQFDPKEPANTSIVYFNNVANLVVMVILFIQRRLNLRRDWMYYAVFNAIVMSITLVVQPRYFYSFYTILCFHAAVRRGPEEKFYSLQLKLREAQ